MSRDYNNKGLTIGILGASDIAFNKFVPACSAIENVKVKAIASRDINGERSRRFTSNFNLNLIDSYDALISDDGIDAVYLPLPPSLHFEWAMKAIKAGKHILIEKPITTKFEETDELVKQARLHNVAIYENYMFAKHKQVESIKKIIESGELGDLRLLRSVFSFPLRSKDDFRYDHNMGGGSLNDCGGYLVKLAQELLGGNLKIQMNCSNKDQRFPEIDLFGSFVLKSDSGICFHGSHGMDNSYSCELEVFGSKGYLKADRIYTAPNNLDIVLNISSNGEKKEINLNSDDHFVNSIKYFVELCSNDEARVDEEYKIINQAKIMNGLRRYDNDSI